MSRGAGFRAFDGNRAPKLPFRLNEDSLSASTLGLWWPDIASGSAVADGVIKDFSGNNRHGDIRGAALTTQSLYSARAGRTNGSSSYLRYVAPSGSAFDTNNGYTVWMRLRANDDDAMFFARYIGTAFGDVQIFAFSGTRIVRFGAGDNQFANSTVSYSDGNILFLALSVPLSGNATGYVFNETTGASDEVAVTVSPSGSLSRTFLFGTDPDTGDESGLDNFADAAYLSIGMHTSALSSARINFLQSVKGRWDLYEQEDNLPYFVPTVVAGGLPAGSLASLGVGR